MKITRSMLLGLALTSAMTAAIPAVAADNSVTIKMVAQNGSGEDGTAVLTQESDGVRVAVMLKNAPAGVAQPTHIHIGTCGAINKAPEYALKNTTDGKGLSTVTGVKLADLLKGKYAVNVHKSATDLGTYVSCGNIVAPAM